MYQWQFGEGNTPPPPGYTGYEFHAQTEEQTKNEARVKDFYASESPTAAVMPESASTFPQNIPDDDEKDKLIVSVLLTMRKHCESSVF